MIAIILTAVLFLGIGIFVGPNIHKTQKQKNIEFRFNEMCNTNIGYSGITSLWKPEGHVDDYFSYNIRSFDGGKVWYALKTEKSNSNGLKDDKVIILGEVDYVYPGFREHKKAWKNLMSYVKENGPIVNHKPTEELDKILDEAGITIVQEVEN